MRSLIDTHVLLWYAMDAPRLSSTAIEFMENDSNSIVVSVASLWEIAIKSSLGKLTLNRPFSAFCSENVEDNGFSVLPIERTHLIMVQNLPFHHRDPFDRLLAAQSLAEEIILLSGDTVFDSYGVTRHW